LPDEDEVEWARQETWKFTARKCKLYDLWVILGAFPIVFLSEGMPGHLIWRYIGIPVLIASRW
jgi:hypothetical protein